LLPRSRSSELRGASMARLKRGRGATRSKKSGAHATRHRCERSWLQRLWLPASSYLSNATMRITIVGGSKALSVPRGPPGNCGDLLQPEEVLGSQGSHPSFEEALELPRAGGGDSGCRGPRARAAPDRHRRGTTSRMAQAAVRALPERERCADGRAGGDACVSSGRHRTRQYCACVTSGNRIAGSTGSRAQKQARHA
jgi:hypothetical protein